MWMTFMLMWTVLNKETVCCHDEDRMGLPVTRVAQNRELTRMISPLVL